MRTESKRLMQDLFDASNSACFLISSMGGRCMLIYFATKRSWRKMAAVHAVVGGHTTEPHQYSTKSSSVWHFPVASYFPEERSKTVGVLEVQLVGGKR